MPPPTGANEPEACEARSRLAVIDDDPSVVRALARLFRSADYSVETYESGEAFLSAADRAEADCIVLDVHLPGLDGFAVHARLREEGSVLPVIFITAHDSEEARDVALGAGARAFLSKPLDGLQLLDEVARVLRAS